MVRHSRTSGLPFSNDFVRRRGVLRSQIKAYMKQHGWKGQFSTPVWNAACFDWMCKDSGFYITLVQTSRWLLFVTTLTPGHTLEISIFIQDQANENIPHWQTHFRENGLSRHIMYICGSGLNEHVRVCNLDLIQFIFCRTAVHVCEVQLYSSSSKLRPSLKTASFFCRRSLPRPIREGCDLSPRTYSGF